MTCNIFKWQIDTYITNRSALNLVNELEVAVSHFRTNRSAKKDSELQGAGSRNEDKFLSKRRFGSIFDSPYHRDFVLLF